MASIFDLIFPRYCLECKKPGRYLCESCVNKLPQLTRIILVTTIFPYKGVIRKAILALKYKYAYDISKELSELVALSLIKSKLRFPEKAILVPIPLHKKRENYRGFNQSGEIGKQLAKKMGWNYLPDLLIRKIATPSQTGLNREKRGENVRDAFILNSKYRSKLEIRDSNLVIFDDVYTTGSTINEAKRVLYKEGFKKVFCLSIAG